MWLDEVEIFKQQKYLKQNLIPLLSKEWHLDSQIRKQFKATRSILDKHFGDENSNSKS